MDAPAFFPRRISCRKLCFRVVVRMLKIYDSIEFWNGQVRLFFWKATGNHIVQPGHPRFRSVMFCRSDSFRIVQAADGDGGAVLANVAEAERRAALGAKLSGGGGGGGVCRRIAARPNQGPSPNGCQSREGVAHRFLAHPAMTEMHIFRRCGDPVTDGAALAAASQRKV
jgi:hypothetical protein